MVAMTPRMDPLLYRLATETAKTTARFELADLCGGARQVLAEALAAVRRPDGK